jgi:transposase-like protein
MIADAARCEQAQIAEDIAFAINSQIARVLLSDVLDAGAARLGTRHCCIAANKKAKAVIDELRASKMSKAADLVEQAVRETPTYYDFPDNHWQKIRTNIPLGRIMKEIRRRTRVFSAFPDGQSCLNLAAPDYATLPERHGLLSTT